MRGKVLDFGCGSMEYKGLFDNAKEYCGLDIEGAQDNGFYAEGVTYYDGKHIPFEDSTFDSVLSVEVFEHVEYLEQIFEELNRIMKIGGHMLFTVPMNFPCHLEPYDFRRFTKWGIKKMLEEHGFEIKEIKGSTTFQNTVRRLEILEWAQRRNYDFVYKLKVLRNNIGFILKNDKGTTEKAPIDWLVVCKKNGSKNYGKDINISQR